MAEISFEVISITVAPQDTGVNQYINIEAVIEQPRPDTRFAMSSSSIEMDIYCSDPSNVSCEEVGML